MDMPPEKAITKHGGWVECVVLFGDSGTNASEMRECPLVLVQIASRGQILNTRPQYKECVRGGYAVGHDGSRRKR